MQLWLIPLLPFAGFLINGVLGRRMPKRSINAIAIGTVVFSFAWALKTVLALGDTPINEHNFTWIQSGALKIGCDFTVDRLTAIMLMVVTGVGSLIHIYSVGYMAHEGGYYRFFAYLNLFMFFMLILVLASNYLLLFVGWEGVGLCSYLLIGFYFDKQFATNAGNKAFIVNRIGDFGFSLGMFYIFKQFGALDFGTVFSQAPGAPTHVLNLIGILLLIGACGKSAQFPLYVWLPDAMAGPTPVSALIHAATMVTAGVYMTARSWTIYMHAPMAMNWVAYVGIATAFFAAVIGLAQNDIKKVFAYSTVSQLGYMFVGVGCGAFSAGIYHLMTHAFFKALLFLGAGSVIHAVSGEQDLRQMGGLRKKIPWTCWTMLCASLAIAGFPFTSGFLSKDAILIAANHHAPWIFWVGVITAGMTAFYVFRAFFLAFFGEYRGQGHPHESPPSMIGPLVVLALLSLGGGYLFKVPEILSTIFPTVEVPEDFSLMAIASGAGLIGVFLAFVMYVWAPAIPDAIVSHTRRLHSFVYNKFYVDEAYNAVIVKPVVEGSRTILWKGADAGLIDGVVNGIGSRAKNVGAVLRLLQSGNIRSYATWVLAGSVVIILGLGVVEAIR